MMHKFSSIQIGMPTVTIADSHGKLVGDHRALLAQARREQHAKETTHRYFNWATVAVLAVVVAGFLAFPWPLGVMLCIWSLAASVAYGVHCARYRADRKAYRARVEELRREML